MAKTNIQDVIAQKKTLETLADCMCCPKIFDVPHHQCFYCEDFKKCKKPSCQECAWSIDNGDSDECLVWLEHDMLTMIKKHTNGNNLEEKTNNPDR